MKEKSIAKKLSAKKLAKLRGGVARQVIRPPVTTAMTLAGHGRGRHLGHHNDRNPHYESTADA